MRLKRIATLPRNSAAIAAAIAAIALCYSSPSQARPIGQAGDRAEAEMATMTIAEKVVNFLKSAAAAATGQRAPSSEPAPPADAAPAPAAGAADAREIGAVPVVARISVPVEERWTSGRYALSGEAARLFDRFIVQNLESPEALASEEAARMTRPPQPAATPKELQFVFTSPATRFSRAPIDALSVALTPEKPFRLGKLNPLTAEEFRFLAGLLLFQRGDKCSVAIGLFHRYSKAPGAAAEANYYMAKCAKQLGLEGDFFERARRTLEAGSPKYAAKILKEIPSDLPDDFVASIGAALSKHLGAKGNFKFEAVDAMAAGNARFWLAQYGSRTGRFKTVLANAPQVPEGHPKRLQAQFLLALAEHMTGDSGKAIRLVSDIAAKAHASPVEKELASIASLNLARLQFQSEDFKESTLNFLKVAKEHPLWLQSLTEMGWAQLRAGDVEGAIGNMYSIQSPYFKAVYKPESYVIRTIGYLNICQYGDAYRTLTKLEKQYRPWLEKMESFSAAKASRTEAVRKFVAGGAKADVDVDGLPSPVLREMARHRDYLNLQKALNGRIDERPRYARLTEDTDRALAKARAQVMASRSRIAELKRMLASVPKNAQLEPKRPEWRSELESEFRALNERFFEIDVMNEAKSSIAAFGAEAAAAAGDRLASLKAAIERTLTVRLERMRSDLKQILDNNELLRYEVFAGSGENIRFQIAGGETSKRVPASVLPQSKSLRWDFDGEYWEDEIGHYRSSLRNNCPESTVHGQARLGGGEEVE